jgi:hypothetical protein
MENIISPNNNLFSEYMESKPSASELRTMLKEHKKSMPRLSAKKHELMDYAGKIGLLKAAEAPLPPSPPPETAPAQKKKSGSTTAAVPASSELPKELKKPEAKPAKQTKKSDAAKSLSEPAKGGLAAYASFVAEKKARGMSHKDAVAAWKGRK